MKKYPDTVFKTDTRADPYCVLNKRERENEKKLYLL